MDIQKNWIEIRKHFNKCFKTNFHVSLASVDKQGNPTVTPIGSLFLNSNQTGFYFEKFPTKLPENSKDHKNICVLAVNSNTFFWLASPFCIKFSEATLCSLNIKSPICVKVRSKKGNAIVRLS
jgi:uncharacterized protein